MSGPRPYTRLRARGARAERGGSTPIDLPRVLMVLLCLGAAVLVVAGLRAIAFLAGPLLLSFVLVIAVHPLRRRLEQRMPGWLASTLCLALLLLLLVCLAVSIVVAAARFVSLAGTYGSDWNDLTRELAARMEDAGVSEEQVRTAVGGLDLSGVSAAVGSAVSGIAGVVSSLVVIVTLLLFMTFDGGAFAEHLEEARRARPSLIAALDRLAAGIRRWIVVTTVFGLVVAALDTAALAIIGLPAALLWGLLAFLTNYIPNIGFVIGLIPPAVLGLLEGGPGEMLTVIAVYCVLNVVIQSIIQPKVVGDTVGLSTTLTFVSLVLWSWVLGPLGAVLAVPMSLVVRAVLLDADPAGQWLEPLVVNRPRDDTTSRPAHDRQDG